MNLLFHRSRMFWPSGATTERLFSSLPPLTPSPLPSRREAHVWYIRPDELKDTSNLKKYMELLSSDERQNVLSMDCERLQKGAILTRTLVRTTLARYCRNDPRSIKFKKGKFGKPEILLEPYNNWIEPSLYFNISHSSSLIACGVTVHVPIGIDVEENKRKTVHNTLSVARRYFSPAEVEHLGAIADFEDQQKEFLKIWTLKEAYVKALGRGFAGSPFKNFTISLASKGIQVSMEPRVHIGSVNSDCHHLTENWKFALLELCSSHYMAICMEGDSKSLGDKDDPMRLQVWRTIPFVEDELVSGTEAVKYIS